MVFGRGLYLFGVAMELNSLCVGFLFGIIAYRMISTFWDLGQLASYVREAEKSALVMLATAAESVAYIQTIKYNSMKEVGIDESTIKMTKNVDDYNFRAWKNSAVSNLLAAFPEYYKKNARYIDWNTAMDFLDKIYHKPRRDDESND